MEAHFFLSQMRDHYHDPDPFRWNLNACLQALRSVPDLMRAALAGLAGGRHWCGEQWKRAASDPILKRFHDRRDFVVHQGMLVSSSRVRVGIFRGRHPMGRAAVDEPEPDVRESSWILLEKFKYIMEEHVGGPVAHRMPGDQAGVQREWIVEGLATKKSLG
jgi:hypothetical protein